MTGALEASDGLGSAAEGLPFDAAPEDVLLLDLQGYEGPLHVLLELARAQKVDLAKIALAPLVDQYLAFIERARGRVDLAADYLVMASWLTLLKSRLLLPKPERPTDEPDPELIAVQLQLRLQRLAEARAQAARLGALMQLDRDVFLNGAPQPVAITTQVAWTATLHDLLKAYGEGRSRATRSEHRIAPRRVYTIESARKRLNELLAELSDWRPLGGLQPQRDSGPEAPSPQSYVASLFSAALDLVRDQKLEARQAGQFAPLYLRRKDDTRAGDDA